MSVARRGAAESSFGRPSQPPLSPWCPGTVRRCIGAVGQSGLRQHPLALTIKVIGGPTGALWRLRWLMLMNAFLLAPLYYELRVGQGGPDRSLLVILPASLLGLALVQTLHRPAVLTHLALCRWRCSSGARRSTTGLSCQGRRGPGGAAAAAQHPGGVPQPGRCARVAPAPPQSRGGVSGCGPVPTGRGRARGSLSLHCKPATFWRSTHPPWSTWARGALPRRTAATSPRPGPTTRSLDEHDGYLFHLFQGGPGAQRGGQALQQGRNAPLGGEALRPGRATVRQQVDTAWARLLLKRRAHAGSRSPRPYTRSTP